MLSIYNSLHRRKEPFVSIHPMHVNMYVCGMTVYDFCHVGHARSMMVFDMVQRWLKASGYSVNYVRNITDIDDKIIQRAAQNGETNRALTNRFINALHEDADALLIERPNHEPRATEYVEQMLAIIDQLHANDLAYQAPNGDVMYRVRSFKPYGKLSGRNIDDLRAGERVDIDHGKEDPLDFVLWKSAKDSEAEDSKWPSKWGSGRPGWHIECSAMSHALLGEHFDIHGGGADLQFPHHENEIAQSEGAFCGVNGCSDPQHQQNESVPKNGMANYWIHNGFVQINNEKMSKSLRNFFTIRDVLKIYDPEVMRFFILRAHYRSPLNYGTDNLDDAKAALTRLYTALNDIEIADDAPIDWHRSEAISFKKAMDDDFNTPEAIAVLFDLATQVNKAADQPTALATASLLKQLAKILGLLQRHPMDFLQGEQSEDLTQQVEQLIEARRQAKTDKDFAKADQIRQQLTNMGITIEDKSGGAVQWRKL